MTSNIILSKPSLDDGLNIHQLIERCPPLDTNSAYCNFLQAEHFSDTSVMACVDNDLVGFISGYQHPKHTDTLFIWQVAIDESARGQGLASRMLLEILRRPECDSINYLETTISPSNQASMALFGKLANAVNGEFQSNDWLDSQSHFHGQHESEQLIRIGPFHSTSANKHT